MVSIKLRFKNIHRFETLIKVLTKHGFGVIFDKLSSKQNHVISPEKHIREILEEMGGAFVKLGQILSLRPDLIPLKYCKELEKLQQDCEAIPFDEIEKTLERELNQPTELIFKNIEKKPIAVGTIAQVHRAKLISGKQVVVKIMKSNIIQQFEEDFELLEYLALKLKSFIPKFIDCEMILKEFKSYTEDELNFETELAHLELMKRSSSFIIPNVHKKLSSKKVLVMDYLDGIALAKKPYLKLNKLKINKLTEVLAINMMKDVFIAGVFHADPHPGNIFLINEKEFGLIDFGIVGVIDDDTKTILTTILYALLNKNIDLLVKSLSKLGVEGDLSSQDFKKDIDKYFGKYYGENLDKIHFGELLNSIISLGNKYGFKIPRNMVMFGKSIATFESVCQQMNPEFNFVRTAKKFLNENMSKMMSAKIFVKKFKREVIEYADLFMSFPKDLKRLIELEQRENTQSEHIEETMKRLELDVVYMQEEVFSFLFFVVFLGLSLFMLKYNSINILGLSIFSIFFGLLSIFCLLLFLFVGFKNLIK